ncbi:MAG: hypothetical protein J5I94_27585 [Phaeodactylibacter sp.]|nr:hypothetical protein [Phaeodactylibacter sp.]
MYRIFTWVTLIFIVTSCNLSSVEDTVVIPDVDDEFYLDIWEALTPEGRFLEFRLRTIDNEPCRNAAIDYEFQQANRELSISINEILREDGCDPGEAAPAYANIRTHSPLPGGFYPLFVDLREKVTSDGQVVVSSEAYNISLEDGGGVVVLRPELRRIPNETIWGYISYENTELAGVADELQARLQSITTPRTLKEGHYGYFFINSSGVLRFIDGDALNNSRTFTYRFVEDKEELLGLLEEYRSAYGESLKIKVFNTLGEEL